jgi:hypothetical protein
MVRWSIRAPSGSEEAGRTEARERAPNEGRTIIGWFGRLAVHPILFAAYAVLFLYSVNLDEVLPVDAELPLVRFVLAAAAMTALLAIPFRSVRRGAVVASAGVVAFAAFGHVAPALADRGIDERAQIVAWAVVIGAAIVYAVRARASLPSVTAGLNATACVLIVAALATILPYEAARAGRASVVPAASVEAGAGASGRRPDIYFLIFDRYGSADALQRRFGITSDLYDWLRSRGFHVPRDSHANYRATDFSLAATLNMQFLDGLTERIGPNSGDRTPARELIQDHAVGRFLKAHGYRYYQLGSWFGPTRSIAIADENIALGQTSEFEAVLRDTTILPAIDHVLGTGDDSVSKLASATDEGLPADQPFRDRVHDGTLFELRQLHRVATAPGPKFVFAHILLPHDPYVFRADGSVISEAASRASDEAALYAGQVAFANSQIHGIVDDLLSRPEAERPIVIIEGDEGPLACRNTDCPSTSPDYLRLRLGNLIAMYLPGVDVQVPDTFTSVNTFRLVFREYFGADLPPLPDRSFTWPDDDHVYDFRDVTDLVSPGD